MAGNRSEHDWANAFWPATDSAASGADPNDAPERQRSTDAEAHRAARPPA